MEAEMLEIDLLALVATHGEHYIDNLQKPHLLQLQRDILKIKLKAGKSSTNPSQSRGLGIKCSLKTQKTTIKKREKERM
jgi:hypothetical protein